MILLSAPVGIMPAGRSVERKKPRSRPVPAESRHALDSYFGVCPYRRAGRHPGSNLGLAFAGTWIHALAHVLIREPVATPDQVRGWLSPGHAQRRVDGMTIGPLSRPANTCTR